MPRKKNPLHCAFSIGEKVHTVIDVEVGNPTAGSYVGHHTSDQYLTEIEAQTIGLRIGAIMKRYGITELHLTKENPNAS